MINQHKDKYFLLYIIRFFEFFEISIVRIADWLCSKGPKRKTFFALKGMCELSLRQVLCTLSLSISSSVVMPSFCIVCARVGMVCSKNSLRCSFRIDFLAPSLTK